MVFRLRPRPGRAYLAGAPLLVAHRGGSRLAPENTMAAFESAVRDWGADMLELDVRLSKDGVVMVIHDDSVDRTVQSSFTLPSKCFYYFFKHSPCSIKIRVLQD